MTFGVSGQLMMNGLVMYDHQTDTLWSQVTGSAISGDFDGTSLQHLAALQTTWGAWIDEYPDTLVLDKGGNAMYDSDPYSAYYSDNSKGLFGESNADTRVDPKEFVVGLNVRGSKKAYPFSQLAKTRIVNDILGDRPVVVIFDALSATATVYDRTVDGVGLTFRYDGEMLLTDVETGSTWSFRSAKAIDGPLIGQRLEQIPTISLFWFAWSDFHPDTDVYTAK